MWNTCMTRYFEVCVDTSWDVCVVTNMILQLEVLGRTRQTDLRSAPGRTMSEELITSQRDSESMRCHACLEQDRGRGNEQQKGFSGKEWRWGGWSPSSHSEGPSPAAYFVSLSPLQVHSYCYTGAAVTSCTVSRWNRAHKHLPSSLKGRLLESKLRVQIWFKFSQLHTSSC